MIQILESIAGGTVGLAIAAGVIAVLNVRAARKGY